MGINWNTVPAFYNDSYTYMEWLGKVTAKVENHEDRITQAEADIDQLQDDVAEIKNTLEDHENRITQAEQDIDALEGRMDMAEDDIADCKHRLDTAENDIDSLEGRMGTAEDDIDALEGRMDTAEGDIDTLEGRMDTAEDDIDDLQDTVTPLVNDTIPVIEEKVAENTASIISIQREGLVLYQDATAATTSSTTSTRIILSIPYERPTPAENAIDVSAVFTIMYNSIPYNFTVRKIVHGVGGPLPKTYGNQPANSTAETYIQGTIGISSSTITLSITRFVLDDVDIAISDITLGTISGVDLLLYRGKTVTPTSEKEAYQASVQIFQDKTIPIDNRTATMIQTYYAAASVDPTLTWATWAAAYNTAHPDAQQLDTTVSPDTNKDGKIDAVDASNIMSYYANASVGRTQYENSDTDKFYQWYLDGNPPHWQY